MRASSFSSFTLALSLATSICACGGNVHVGQGGSAGSGGSPGGGPDCPAAEPSGGPCDVPAVRCTYGDSPRPECRNDWTCLNGQWTTTKSACSEPQGCLPSQPQENLDCKFEGDVCTYGPTLCECNACSFGPCMQTAKWSCIGPPTTSGCPGNVPNDGTTCSSEGLTCTYGHPCGYSGVSVTCTDGAWIWETEIACPA